MTSTRNISCARYTVGDCAFAAFAGALTNSLLLTVRWNALGAGIFLAAVLFSVGFFVLAVAGRPMARSLASEGRDTLVNGLMLGAATGSLVGTLVAGIAIAALFGSSTAAVSLMAPLFALLCGVVDGAVAGVTFVALSRRKTDRLRLDRPREPIGARGRTGFRWFWLVVALGFGMPAVAILTIAARDEPKREPFPIAGTTYQWPAETRISPPQPPGYYGKGYVSDRSSERYPDPDAFFIIYDGNAQEALNEAGLPHLQFITSRFDKPGEFSFRTTSAGQVVCRRRSVEVGIAYPCGLSFVHRGARWQLKFGAHRAADAELIYKQAISRLESLRRQSGR